MVVSFLRCRASTGASSFGMTPRSPGCGFGVRHGFEVPLEGLESPAPLLRDHVQVAARHLELLRFDRPTAFPPLAHPTDQTHTGEHLQMLGDRLPCDVRSRRETGDGLWPARAQAGHGP